MQYFYFKVVTLIVSILVIITGIIFLFSNNKDTLVYSVPGQAETYFHAKNNISKHFNSEKLDLFISYLENNSTLNSESWQTILTSHSNEIGIFSINKQIFGILYKNNKNTKLLQSLGIDYQLDKHTVIFPKIARSNTNLSDLNWYNSINKKVNFSKFSIYIRNNAIIKDFVPQVSGTHEAILINGDKRGISLVLTLNGKGIGQNYNKKELDSGNFSLKNTEFVIKNIQTKNFNIQKKYKVDQISNHLLNKLDGFNSFFKNQDGFLIVTPKEDNNLEQIQNDIKVFLASVVPDKQQKTLPDGTISIQLVANPEKWQFEIIDINGTSFYKIEDEESQTQIFISEQDQAYLITNQAEKIENTSYQLTTQSYCSKYSHTPMTHSKFSSNIFSSITFINHNQNKTSICID